jgi:pyrroloquinoline quinone (PQQ) biosynthesis protein C
MSIVSASTSTTATGFNTLNQRMQACWSHILAQSAMVKTILSGSTDRRLYALYLIETFHYTRHNAKNQALVAVCNDGQHSAYLQFCLRHAADEAGHELMALHDLKTLGVDPDLVTATQPMPATETLIAYLYWVSIQGNAFQRLGYSYWAENCYEAINPVLNAVKQHMSIPVTAMTFFIDHATIDTKHAEMVHHMIQQTAKTEADWAAIARVLEISLTLTGRILDDVASEYQKLLAGDASSAYAFLNQMGQA